MNKTEEVFEELWKKYKGKDMSKDPVKFVDELEGSFMIDLIGKLQGEFPEQAQEIEEMYKAHR